MRASLWLLFHCILGYLELSYSGPPDLTDQKLLQLTETNNILAINIYKRLISKEKGNLIFCPPCIMLSLSMLYLGARNSTADEIKCALGLDFEHNPESEIDSASFHQTYFKLLEYLSNSSGITFTNRIYKQGEAPVKREFQNDLETFYNASVLTEDIDVSFKWKTFVSKNLALGKDIDYPPSKTTVMKLSSAVHFKTVWHTKFEKRATRLEAFYNCGARRVRVPMMHMHAHFLHAWSAALSSHVVELPFAGKRTSMVIILPKYHKKMCCLDEVLTLGKVQDAIQSLRKERVRIRIPRFRLFKGMNMNEVLRQLGVTEAFTSQADLSGISECTEEHGNITIAHLVHDTGVEIKEKGQKRPVFEILPTKTELWERVKNYFGFPSHTAHKFYCDHPFLFIIRERTSGLFLFIGKFDRFRF